MYHQIHHYHVYQTSLCEVKRTPWFATTGNIETSYLNLL